MITPRQIAKGVGDRYILRTARTIGEAKQTVYIRLMAEMNGYWNAYSAFNADGSAAPRRPLGALVQAGVAAVHADRPRRSARRGQPRIWSGSGCRGS